jgi:hypothetical protein
MVGLVGERNRRRRWQDGFASCLDDHGQPSYKNPYDIVIVIIFFLIIIVFFIFFWMLIQPFE